RTTFVPVGDERSRGASCRRPARASTSRPFAASDRRRNATTRSLPAYGPEATPKTEPRVPSVRYMLRVTIAHPEEGPAPAPPGPSLAGARVVRPVPAAIRAAVGHAQSWLVAAL